MSPTGPPRESHSTGGWNIDDPTYGPDLPHITSGTLEHHKVTATPPTTSSEADPSRDNRNNIATKSQLPSPQAKRRIGEVAEGDRDGTTQTLSPPTKQSNHHHSPAEDLVVVVHKESPRSTSKPTSKPSSTTAAASARIDIRTSTDSTSPEGDVSPKAGPTAKLESPDKQSDKQPLKEPQRQPEPSADTKSLLSQALDQAATKKELEQRCETGPSGNQQPATSQPPNASSSIEGPKADSPPPASSDSRGRERGRGRARTPERRKKEAATPDQTEEMLSTPRRPFKQTLMKDYVKSSPSSGSVPSMVHARTHALKHTSSQSLSPFDKNKRSDKTQLRRSKSGTKSILKTFFSTISGSKHGNRHDDGDSDNGRERTDSPDLSDSQRSSKRSSSRRRSSGSKADSPSGRGRSSISSKSPRGGRKSHKKVRSSDDDSPSLSSHHRDSYTDDESDPDDDPHDLMERFVIPQMEVFEDALQEINEGHKESCWFWFVIPTAPYIVDGVERGSVMNRRYCLRTDEAAHAFLDDKYRRGVNLRTNYLTMLEAILEQLENGNTLRRLFGSLDDVKAMSSFRLFQRIAAQRNDSHLANVCTKLLERGTREEQKRKEKSKYRSTSPYGGGGSRRGASDAYFVW